MLRLFLILVGVAWTASGLRAQTTATGADASAGAAVEGAIAAPVSGGTVQASDARYELRSGDRLRFRIEEDPATGRDPILVAVNTVGEAGFPVSRDSDIRVTVSVRGKTLSQVKELLTARLLEEYYNRATVELALEEKIVTPGKVQFFGEMRGTVPMLPDHPPMFLSEQMLQMGIPDFADLRRVKIHRMDPITQTSRVIEVDVRSIIRGGQRSKDEILRDGDRVEVPQKFFN
ncbi:MAG: hypothetical protein AB7O66_25130 [Limisphaerales bacterium]